MKIAVYDTYVTKENGEIMHFDIFVEESTKNLDLIFSYGKEYLKSKNVEHQLLNAKECSFCHIEEATKDVQDSIVKQGYYIYEMEGC